MKSKSIEKKEVKVVKLKMSKSYKRKHQKETHKERERKLFCVNAWTIIFTLLFSIPSIYLAMVVKRLDVFVLTFFDIFAFLLLFYYIFWRELIGEENEM